MIKRTRAGYPVLTNPDDPIELEAIFGLEHATEQEQAVLDRHNDPVAKAAALLTLRCLAHLGYVPPLEDLPKPVVRYIGKQLRFICMLPPLRLMERAVEN